MFPVERGEKNLKMFHWQLSLQKTKVESDHFNLVLFIYFFFLFFIFFLFLLSVRLQFQYKHIGCY